MIIKTISQAKEVIGKQLWWDEVSKRYKFVRTGILDDVLNRQLSFDGNQDYRSISCFANLRDTENSQ